MRSMFENYVYPHQPAECPQCGEVTDSRLPFCGKCKFDLRHGTLKNSKKGMCIYCERTGVLSDEHFFPKWIQEHFPKRYSRTAHVLVRPEKAESPEHAEMQKATKLRAADPYDAQVRNVCVDCNNGWMSALQVLAKPLLLEHALGTLRSLSCPDKDIVARWAAMTSISMQSYGHQLMTKQHQLKALMTGTMPSGWRVSRGLMSDSSFAGRSISRNGHAPVQGAKGEYLAANMSLIVIERAVFQTFSSSDEYTLPYAVDYSGFGQQAIPMQPIWPLDRTWDNISGLALGRANLDAIPKFLAP